jgi:hypothetical protein
VEKWLIEVEQVMRESLQAVTRRAFDAYAVTERSQWIFQWPGQVVICGSQMYWTAEVAAAISAHTVRAYEDQCTAQLQEVKSAPFLSGLLILRGCSIRRVGNCITVETIVCFYCKSI